MTQIIPVTDKTGQTGELVLLAPSSAQEVVVRYADKEVIVPRNMIVVGKDGRYQLPLRFSELADLFPADRHQADTTVIPVVQEELAVRKQAVETGKVRVIKNVVEQEEVVTEPVYAETIEIERVPVHRVIDAPVSIRHEGAKTIIPVMKEVIVVQKQLMLTEEIHISKARTQSYDTQEVTLRREEVRIEREQLDNLD